jgi:small subunit ribosomal protein S18
MARRPKPKESTRKIKKKISALTSERIDYVDYKDVALLTKFMSDRSKIRARRVNGNSSQQQRDIATAVKNAREMALMPYTKRVTNARVGGPRPDRGGDGPKGPRDTETDVDTDLDVDIAGEVDETEEVDA